MTVKGPPVLWDRWFEERINYDRTTGKVRYFRNGVEEIVGTTSPLPAGTRVYLTMSAWGWRTGHSHYVDDLGIWGTPTINLSLPVGSPTHSHVSVREKQTDESQLRVCQSHAEQAAHEQVIAACVPLVWSENLKIRKQASELLDVALNETNRILARASSRSVLPTVPDPYIVHGGCPGEGCMFGVWMAKAATPIYEKPGNRGAAGQLARGERVVALLGELRVRPVKGKVIGKIDQLRLGEPVYLLDYMGEGQSNVWIRGRVLLDPRWGGNCRPAPACVDAIRFPVEYAPSEWWVKIQRRNGQTGWVSAGGGGFSGQGRFE
jgi:hypothetical protein